MEVDLVQGNEEAVVVVDRYWVVPKEHGASQHGSQHNDVVIEWKADTRRYPKMRLRGENYANSEENLMKTFKEGEYVVFLDFDGKGLDKA